MTLTKFFVGLVIKKLRMGETTWFCDMKMVVRCGHDDGHLLGVKRTFCGVCLVSFCRKYKLVRILFRSGKD